MYISSQLLCWGYKDLFPILWMLSLERGKVYNKKEPLPPDEHNFNMLFKYKYIGLYHGFFLLYGLTYLRVVPTLPH